MTLLKRLKVGWGIAPVILFISVWEGISRLGLISTQGLFPPFSLIIQEFFKLTMSGILADSFLKSLIRVLIGFCSGSLIGISIGILMGWKEVCNKAISPVISIFYPIPALGWLPLLMVWIGINELLPVVVVFICSFFPVCYTTASGIRNVDIDYVMAAKSLGASDLRILATVVLPLSLPAIFTGLRLEAGMSWRVIIAAEMVAIPTGLGALLMRAQCLVRVDIIIVCLMILSLMCFLFERFFMVVERRLTCKWATHASH